MITKIQAINNYGIFYNFVWPDELECFKKYNVIYGWNGCGKTTLSNVFRQLEEKTVFPECEGFRVITDGGEIDSDTIIETQLMIRVFNRDFVNENVFTSSGTVSPIFHLGKDDISKKKEIDRLSIDIGKLTERRSSLSIEIASLRSWIEHTSKDGAKKIKELLGLSASGKYSKYNKLDFKNRCEYLKEVGYVDKILKDDEYEIIIQRIIPFSGEIIKPIRIIFPDLEEITNITNFLPKYPIDSKPIERLQLDSELNDWVGAGFKLIKENSMSCCPFCEQSLSTETLKKLANHFNEGYADLLINIEKYRESIVYQKNKLGACILPDKARIDREFSDQYERKRKTFHIELGNYIEYLENIINFLEYKKQFPFKTLNPALPIPSSHVLRIIDEINQLIEQSNSKIINFADRKKIATVQLEDHFVAEILDEYQAKEGNLIGIPKVIESIDVEINNLRKTRESLETQLVEHRAPAEKINSDISQYLGRDEIQLRVMENGYQITRYNQIANALSEGEKTAVSFVYFLNSLKDKSFDINNGIIVVDDPISSLDSNSLYNAFSF
jgi:wobble nucleotide-excising tRNase